MHLESKKLLFSCFLFFLFTIPTIGCMSAAENASGKNAYYVEPNQKSEISGVGIDSRDIILMTGKMMEDILGASVFFQSKTPPKVIIDAEYFKNEGSTRIDKNLITDKLRTGLNRAAAGKMIFISREHLEMLMKELALKQSGITSDENEKAEPQIYAADYRLGGRISTLDKVNPSEGTFSRYHQILFEMIDLKTGAIVWSNAYDFKKVAQEDVIYR